MEDTHTNTIKAIGTLKTWARQYVHPDLEELVDQALSVAYQERRDLQNVRTFDDDIEERDFELLQIIQQCNSFGAHAAVEQLLTATISIAVAKHGAGSIEAKTIRVLAEHFS